MYCRARARQEFWSINYNATVAYRLCKTIVVFSCIILLCFYIDLLYTVYIIMVIEAAEVVDDHYKTLNIIIVNNDLIMRRDFRSIR